ncbi:hypothetical protein DFJ77DRAFT_473144 [Powellomyces hirtus]|nr:hypothetical protein DFJ77DRAFT_473144 [Powellomyces hirtus]
MRVSATSFAVACTIGALTGTQAAPVGAVERVTFVDQVASRIPGTPDSWHVNFHGYVTVPAQSTPDPFLLTTLQVFAKTDEEKATLKERYGWFAVSGVEDAQLPVTIPASPSKAVTLPTKTDNTGLFDAAVNVSITGPTDKHGAITFKSQTLGQDQVGGMVYLVEPEGVSIISDIDDTIKITEVLDKVKVLKHTFLQPFEAVYGMPKLYTDLQTKLSALNKRPAFHYLSRSPWTLFGGLKDFTTAAGFPAGQFILRNLSLKDRSFFDFLVGGSSFKVDRIRDHISLFPNRTLIMIGDSGELDPESYGVIAREKPQLVSCIAIRAIEGQDAAVEKTKNSPERYQIAFDGVPKDKWFTFTDASKINVDEMAAGKCGPPAL